MELVYPIYLDIPMMMGFLASLEGGIVEEAELEKRTGDSEEKVASASLKASVSGLFTSILGLEASTDASKTISENIESSYKGIIRYPTSALFVRLRNLLLEQDMLVSLNQEFDLDTLNFGDIVEFSGYVSADPSYQIRHVFGQILPIVEASHKINDAKIEQGIAKLDNTKPNDTIDLLGQEVTIQNKRHATTLQSEIRSNQEIRRGEANLYGIMGEMLDGLFDQDGADALLFSMQNWKAISRVYPTFIRNEQVHEVHNANWRCVGKVIGFIPDGETFDLLKGSPIGYLAKDQFAEIAKTLQNDQINIEINNPKIKGPALIIATMAIFT